MRLSVKPSCNNAEETITRPLAATDEGGVRDSTAIATQTDEEINQFLTKLTNSQKRVSVVFLGPFPDGNLGTVTVPGITRSFEGQSILIRIKNVVENYLMVMEPTAKAFKCIQIDTDKEISCF